MPIIDAPKCQHQREDGTSCQRPARHRLRFCDFHHREHKRNAKKIAERARQRWFERVVLDDPKSIQKALAQLMQRLLNGEIDNQRAGQLLHKLQMASLDAHGNGHYAVQFDNRGWLNPKQPARAAVIWRPEPKVLSNRQGTAIT
jgi:hypothetical protein